MTTRSQHQARNYLKANMCVKALIAIMSTTTDALNVVALLGIQNCSTNYAGMPMPSVPQLHQRQT
eukprot:scaffold299996_cov22-Prasinocladus_malaysianus.AAC.1